MIYAWENPASIGGGGKQSDKPEDIASGILYGTITISSNWLLGFGS